MNNKTISLMLAAFIIVILPLHGDPDKTPVPSDAPGDKDVNKTDEFLDDTYKLPPCKVSAFMGNIDIYLKLLDDRIVYVTVTRVTPQSTAAFAMVRPGMQIDSINGHWLAGLSKTELSLIMLEFISDRKLSLIVRDDIMVPKDIYRKYEVRLRESIPENILDRSMDKHVDKRFPQREIIIQMKQPRKPDMP